MDGSERGGARVTVGSVRIAGAPPGTAAGPLGEALKASLEGQLASGPRPPLGGRSFEIPRLRVRLPAGAGEREIAEAVARAVRSALAGEGP